MDKNRTIEEGCLIVELTMLQGQHNQSYIKAKYLQGKLSNHKKCVTKTQAVMDITIY